jgi:hypothetical protein
MECERCHQPTIEIEHYGEKLVGCIECNCWWGGRSAFRLWKLRVFCQGVPGCTPLGLGRKPRVESLEPESSASQVKDANFLFSVVGRLIVGLCIFAKPFGIGFSVVR